MPKKRLTAAMVERISPPAKGQVEYYDLNMPGFALRVSYSGTKSWIVMARVHGKLTRLTLGEWPIIGLAEAHEAAQVAKIEAKTGGDPRESKRQAALAAEDAASLTFGGMANQFIERYAKIRLRPRTIEAYEAALRGERTKAWRDRPISSISRGDMIVLLDQLEAEDKHATARLMLAYLRKFFNWCAERDVISDLPTHRIRLNGSVKSRDRVLAINELHRVWNAAGAVGGTGSALVQLLMLTGQRRFETSMMRWQDLSELDGDNPLWSIPGEMTKNHRPHTVPLASEAVKVILSLPRFEGSELVFTTTGATPFSGFSKLKRQIDRQIAEDGGQPLPPWTMHDLRRSLVTGLNEQGIAAPHIIEAIVNHVSGHRGGIAGVYNRATYMAERRRALETWAKGLTSTSSEADVVWFPTRSA